MKKIIIPILALALFSCQNKDEKKTSNQPQSSSQDAVKPSTQQTNQTTTQPGKMIVPTFTVKLDLTPELEEKLKSGSETVMLSIEANVNGDFDKETQKKLDQYMDEKESAIIGQLEKELITERTLTINDLEIDKAIFDLVGEKNIDISVQMWSGRKGYPNNIIDGEFSSVKYTVISGHNFSIKGKVL